MITKRDLKRLLSKYGSINIEGNRFYVRIKGKKLDRERVLRTIHELLSEPWSAVLKFDNYRLSRLGYVQLGLFRICVKPHPSEKIFYSGKFNEIFLYEKILTKLQNCGMVNVVFVHGSKRIIYRNIVKCEVVTKREKHKKSDIRLFAKNNTYNISIKQDDGERYESGDTRFGHRARQLLEQMKLDGTIGITKVPNRPVYRISEELVIPMNAEEAEEVMFGIDADVIIIQTFNQLNFVETTKSIIVNCNGLYKRGDKPEVNDLPVWLIRNDSSRNSKAIGIPGIRVEAVFTRRILRRRRTPEVSK